MELKSITFPGIAEPYELPAPIDPSQFAPSGYGLGIDCTNIDDWNNATVNGWYKSNVNSPTGQWCFGYVTAYNQVGTIIQEAFMHGNGVFSKATRLCLSGTWKEWEWVNPPMALGVEYRTTERHDGKAVYTKLVDFGALPSAATSKKISAGGKFNYVSLYGIITNGTFTYSLPHINNDGLQARLAVSGSELQIHVTGDMSAYTGLVTIKYTKE